MSPLQVVLRTLAVLVLAVLAACDAKPKAKKAEPLRRAEGSIFLYNSTGRDLTVNVSIGETENAVALDIRPGGAKRLPTEWAQRYRFKVAGQAALNQTVNVPPSGEGKGDLLLDFGGRGSFHRWPLFYAPFGQAYSTKVPDELRDRYRVEPIPGPRARYDLDFRAEGLNMGPHAYLPTDRKDGGISVHLVIVDDAILRTLQEGGELDIFER